MRTLEEVRLLSTGHGTHHYDVIYTGEWEDWELINAVDLNLRDNPTREQLEGQYNFGGNVIRYGTIGKKLARVNIYYD